MHPNPPTGLTRRQVLAAFAGATAVVLVGPGCGHYAPESGVAYEPWDAPLRDPVRPELAAVAGAILASSPHNTQPWRFETSPERIRMYVDTERWLGAMDPLRREMYIGLGCALENLVIAARANGREPGVALFPDGTDGDLVADIGLVEAPALNDPYFDAIPRRHTHRGWFLDEPAPAGLEARIAAAIEDPSIRMRFLGTESERAVFRRETIAATRAIVDDREMNEAAHAWFRHTADDIREHRDGVTLDPAGLGGTTRFLAKVSAEADAETSGSYWIRATETRSNTGSAFVILGTADRVDRQQQIAVGRAWQRLHLWATDAGLAVQPLNQLAERQDREQVEGLAPRYTDALNEMIGDASWGGQMLFRIGVAFDDTFESPRRPLAWVNTEVA